MQNIEFIETKDIEDSIKNWDNFSNERINVPGIYSISLYKVYANVKDIVPYQLVNIIECKNLEEYKKNFFIEEDKNDYEICYSKGNLQIDSENILLISPYEITEAQVAPCLKLWREASRHVEKNKDLKGVRLFKATDKNQKFKLITFAEWKSIQAWKSAHQDASYDEIREKIKAYKKHSAFCVHVNTKKQ